MKRRFLLVMVLLMMVFTLSFSQGQREPQDLKVFISVDMEGVAGVVNWEEVSRNGKDYDYFREIMTKETNEAIRGALAAGATEIVVRDSHGSGRNILPELLHERAKLLRDWSGGHLSMMEGIDKTFDAVIFIGYHAKAGTPDSPLAHTMSSANITDVSINGVSLPEAGINGLIAGCFDVPVVFLSGGRAICNQAKGLFGEVETVAVKEGIGNANLNLHPAAAREKIFEGVKKALENRKKYEPYKLKAPYKLELTLKNKELVSKAASYPGAQRTGEWELTYTGNDMMDIIKAFHGMH